MKTYRSKILSLEREERKKNREEEEKGAVIEVLDKNHKAGDHFNREVSAGRVCVGLSGPALLLTSVWVSCLHLIASSIPVKLRHNLLLGYYFSRRAPLSGC